MKILFYGLLAGIFAITSNTTLAYAQNENAKEAEQHLEKAAESGEKGDAVGVAIQAEEAKEHIIEENKENPYIQPLKVISGENPKAEHDKAIFEEINKAKGHAKNNEAVKAAEHIKNAKIHLNKKEQSK